MMPLFDLIGVHGYWSSAGLTEWNALRWRRFPKPSVPIAVLECGRDRVRDGPNGTWLPSEHGDAFGWRAQGITAEQYLAELAAYDAALRADGVFGVVFTTSPNDEWARKGFSVDDLADRCHFTNLGPHDLEGRSPQALAWAARASIVKSCDQTAAIRRAPANAITVYRRIFSPLEQDEVLERGDADHVVNRIVEGLAGFRHPNLHVELLNEVGRGRREQYLRLARIAVPRLHAAGLKVAGPSWATGDYEDEDWRAFALGAAPTPPEPTPGGTTVPDIVTTGPYRESLAHPENWSAGPRATTLGVVIHATRGGGRPETELSATVNWFKNADAQVSAHLVIGLPPFSEVVRCVRDDDVAWHAREANRTHLGIEICQPTPTTPITAFQYEAAAEACRLWATKYNFPLRRVMTITQPGIVGHEDTEPGKRDRKSDPGPAFDWPRFLALLDATPAPTRAELEALARAAAARYGVDEGVLFRQIMAESSWNPRAVSASGAKGLMQLMDGTARELGVTDPFDPAQNIEGGTRFLAYLLGKYGRDYARALAAYNWGPANVDRAVADHGDGWRAAISAQATRYLEKIAPLPPTPAPEPAPDPFDVEAVRGRLWTAADDLERNGWPWFAQAVKAAVALSKTER
jgi:hypothetical protein